MVTQPVRLSFGNLVGDLLRQAPWAALLWLAAITLAQAQPRAVLNPTVEPAQVRIGVAEKLRIWADISDPNVIASGVNLLKVGAPGTNPTIVGVLKDDGTGGDEIAGDGRYSIELSVNETVARTFVYRISAPFKGTLLRTVTPDLPLAVVANRAPVAVAGMDQAVRPGAVVLLDGRQSYDLDGDLLRFRWTLLPPNGSAAQLDNAAYVKPSFTADVAGTYRVQLVVDDGLVDSTLKEVSVTATAPNAVPTARIASVSLPFTPASPVPLSGAGSVDPEGQPLTYAWAVKAKPATSTTGTPLSATTGATSQLLPDKPGRYLVELTVRDGSASSTPAQAWVTLYTPNAPPTVDAGADQSGKPTGSVVGLQGTASDLNAGDSLVDVRWTFIAKPAGSTATLANAGALVPSFTADQPGDYLIELAVTDSRGAIGRARVVVRAVTLAPVAITLLSANPASGTAPLAVQFQSQAAGGTGTYNYGWTFGDNTTSATQNPSHTYAQAGTFNATVTATDGQNQSASQSVPITANPVVVITNQPPQVNAGPDQTVVLPAQVTLTGSATDDGLPNPPGALTYAWSKLSGPGTVSFGAPTLATTSASFSQAGTYVLRLAASDSALSGTGDVTVTVNPAGIVGPQIVPIADRTVSLGSRFQQVVQATTSNLNDTLGFTLPTAPTGAAMNPAPLIDWTPTAGQLGTHTFTATVTDGAGQAASATFHVTVVHTNQPPRLATQVDVILPIGTPFSRTLTAIDPDAGDTLTFALVSGPPGMTLTGSALGWSTAGRAAGDYPVTVSVTDAAGLLDSTTFTVTLQPAAAVTPIAVDDVYAVRLGQTLTVTAPGALANDLDPMGGSLTASRLTDPDKGTLAAFNANGSFVYEAPAVLPGPAFVPVLRNHRDLSDSAISASLMIDLDGDGKPEIVTYGYNHVIYAVHADTGALYWRADFNFFTGCTPYGGSATYKLAAGDLDDDERPEIVTTVACAAESGSAERIMALDGQTGAVKWISPVMAAVPVSGDAAHLTSKAVPTIARLHAGESPSVLINVQGLRGHRIAIDSLGNPIVEPWCRLLVATVPDGTYQPNPAFPPHYENCRGVIELNGSDGTIRQRMIAERNTEGQQNLDGSNEGGELSAPVVVDLDGDGTPEIVAGGVVFNHDGSVRWRGAPNSVLDIAVGNFDDTPDIEVVRHERTADRSESLAVYKHDGTLLWRLPFTGSTVASKLTVVDLDGDGKADLIHSVYSNLCAIRHDGNYRWCRDMSIGGVNPFNSHTRYTAFDFDGDGKAELVVQTPHAVLFLDGANGKQVASFPVTAAATGSSVGPPAGNGPQYTPFAPMVGDVDGDGHADLVFLWNGDVLSAAGRITVLKGQINDWRPARGIQNQFAYHVANVEDNGRIPATVPLPNNFAIARTNVFGTQAQVLPPVDARAHARTTFTYKASRGALDSAPATVAIDIAPANRPPQFDSTPPTRYFRTSGGISYAAHASDPDVGDTVTYSILDIQNAARCTINATSGLLSCPSFGYPSFWIVLAATDSQGDRSMQLLQLTAVSALSTVPNVVGQTQVAASASLSAAGLAVGAITSIAHPSPAGQVIAQAPSAGASVPTGEAVALSVSTGPAPVVMPSVVGDSLALATSRLAAIGLTTAVTPQFSSTIPVNQVMAQSPLPGTLVVPIPANPAMLTISAGPPLAGTIDRIVVEPGTGTRIAGESLQYRAIAIFTDNTSADVTLSATWSSTQTSVATVNAVGLAHAGAAGTTTVGATVGSASGQATLNAVARVAGDVVMPVAFIAAPTAGATITGPVTVTGTATDANLLRYELAYAPPGDSTWTVIGEGTSSVTNGTLATFDPTTLVNDLYTLRLTVLDRGGNQTVATTTVQVSGNMKVGLFSLAFQDLQIPMAGIPITVTRTYDSRDKNKGDFGVGWRLSLQTLRLRANRTPGTGWVRSTSGAVVTLSPTSEHKVSLTLGDGRVEEFDMVVSPMSNLGSLDATSVTGFAARPGTVGRLQVLGNTSLLILKGALEDELVDDTTLNTYDPKLFRYTSIEGMQIEIDRDEGVKKISDANGNSITFGPNGIIHSTGHSVTFTRDAQNRITQVTDPLGQVQSYVYDGNGDLASHANAAGNVTRFKYDRNHGLIDVVDPTGNHAARNDYDASGRLVRMTDANGRQITFTHNVAGQEELISDRRGNLNRLLYDARGNVLSSEKGVTIDGVLVNAVTTTTYDAQNNETSRVDADGRRTAGTFSGVLPLTQVVDPAGLNLTTSLVYNAQSDPTSITDPGGRAFAFTYDGNRNITNLSTPLQGAVISASNAQGLAVRNQDALGNATVMTRDGAGRVTRMEVFDATQTLLRRTDFTYDAVGNNSSETLYRTIGGVLTPLVTQYTYDAANRLVAITNPVGSVSRIEYDASGRVIAEVDPLGRRTTYAFDTLGRLVQTTAPDGGVERQTYDANGNVATITDAAGRTTTYSYDELDRQVRVTLPDGSFTQTIYSPGGRVVAAIDALGNRTDYAYDAAGRRTSVTLPPVANGPAGPQVRPQRTTTYTALGAPLGTTDPDGRVTTYGYDANGRLVLTTHPDGSTVQSAYDALGRRTSVTNEEGQVTRFVYDGLGRLVSVSGHGGDAAYAYDEAGNLITQTDALGRVTRLRYDALNRLVERQYPGGERELLAYDAVGNVIGRTDGLGRTTTFAYDAMNRVTSKILPGAVTVAYTYTTDGRRSTVTDPRGVTTYGYDGLGRLASVTQPTGEVLNYARDANGNLMSLASPAAIVSYGYDALNRLVQVSAPEGISRMFYDLGGNRVRQIAANGIATDAVFDARGRPTHLSHRTAGGALLQSYTATYLPTGRRSQVTEFDGSVEIYAYDANGRLASETRTGTNPRSVTHSYDAVGNRVRSVNGGAPTTFSYDVDDRLISDGTSTIAWDANGNMVSRTQGATVTQFRYDPEDRLVAITGGGIANQYVYDADGNRVQADTAGGTTRFLVDTANITGLSQVLEERSAGGALQARYSYGNGLLAMARGASTAFHVRDMMGSTRALADAAGTITDGYQYDAYGNAASAFGSTANPYRYRGERLDADSGLYQLRARYYSPRQGGFVSRDPLAGQASAPTSLNRYVYANSDPINYGDPTGMFSLSELAIVQAISNFLKAGDTVTKLGAGCAAYQTLAQAQDLAFAATVGIVFLVDGQIIVAELAKRGDGFRKDMGWAKLQPSLQGQAPLVDLERKEAKPGSLKRATLSLIQSGTAAGVKAGFEAATSDPNSALTADVSVTYPPLGFKTSGGIKGKLLSHKFGCPFPANEISVEFGARAYVGGSTKEIALGGISSELAIKLNLFGGRYVAAVPLMGVDLGVGLHSGLMPVFTFGGAVIGLDPPKH